MPSNSPPLFRPDAGLVNDTECISYSLPGIRQTTVVLLFTAGSPISKAEN